MTSSPRETSVLKHRPANEYKWSNVTASVPMAKGEMRKFIGTLKVQSTSRRMSSLSRTRIRCNTVTWSMRTSEYICCILKLGFTKLLKKCKIWYLQNRANKIHFIIKIMNFVSTYTIDSKSKYICRILKLGFTKLFKKCKIWYLQNRAKKIHFSIKIMNFVSICTIDSKSAYGIQSWYTWNLEQCWIALELIVAEYDKTRIRLVSDIPSTWELKSETTLMRTVGKLYGI